MTNESADVIERSRDTPYGDVLSGGNAARYGYEAKEHETTVGDTDFHATF